MEALLGLLHGLSLQNVLLSVLIGFIGLLLLVLVNVRGQLQSMDKKMERQFQSMDEKMEGQLQSMDEKMEVRLEHFREDVGAREYSACDFPVVCSNSNRQSSNFPVVFDCSTNSTSLGEAADCDFCYPGFEWTPARLWVLRVALRRRFDVSAQPETVDATCEQEDNCPRCELLER